jgi:hypothetical protein
VSQRFLTKETNGYQSNQILMTESIYVGSQEQLKGSHIKTVFVRLAAFP